MDSLPSDPAEPRGAPATGAVPARPRRALAIGAAAAAGGLAAWAGLRRFVRPAGPATLPSLSYPVIDGRRLGPPELLGRVVLVNFWATSCAVCVAEMPEMVRLYREFAPRGLELLAIAMPYDRPDHVLHYAQTRRLPFPVALDPIGEAVAAWGGVEATPASWLVGPDGRVMRHWLGRPDFARLRRDIEGLLPAPRA